MKKMIMLMTLSMFVIGFSAIDAAAQQPGLATNNGPTDNYQLRQEIKSLQQKENQLRSRLKITQDRVRPLYDQLKQISSQIKPLREELKQIGLQLSMVHNKLGLDVKKLNGKQ